MGWGGSVSRSPPSSDVVRDESASDDGPLRPYDDSDHHEVFCLTLRDLASVFDVEGKVFGLALGFCHLVLHRAKAMVVLRITFKRQTLARTMSLRLAPVAVVVVATTAIPPAIPPRKNLTSEDNLWHWTCELSNPC